MANTKRQQWVDAIDQPLHKTEIAVIELLAKNDHMETTRQIADETNLGHEMVRAVMQKLRNRGMVIKTWQLTPVHATAKSMDMDVTLKA